MSELGVAVAHARHVPAADRQRWRVEVEAQGTSGAVVVATCHRVEVLATVDRLDRLPPLNGTERLDGRGAIRHVVALAVGLESLVVGEDQVLHQLREAVGAARASAALPAELDRLADVSLRAGRLARSWRTGPSRSLADVALDRIAGPSALTGRTVAVVGAGEMGRLAARAARQRGARIVVASRRTDSAERLAREVGAVTDSLGLDASAASLAGVFVALRGAWVAPVSTWQALVAGSVRVVDLSAPPAIGADEARRLGPLLTPIDALRVDDAAQDGAMHRRLARLVDDAVADYLQWLEARAGRGAAEALAERTRRERAEELDSLWRRLPALDAEARDEISRMTEHLAERLMREPLTRLGHDVDGRHEAAARELFGL